MSSGRDEGPVYYREIQKNAYLKRIPDENNGKLRPLVHKKPPLKPMWTLLCVHNGKVPYLEQYPQQDCPSTHAHKPIWRACLKSARHVTASVKPHLGQEYDFLVDTESGPVRMLAPDWDAMQDWVTTLRTKLHELRILPRGENVYGAPPAAPPPRAAARDPTSPLPPTPPVPVDRVPGIELGPNIRPIAQTANESAENTNTTNTQTITTETTRTTAITSNVTPNTSVTVRNVNVNGAVNLTDISTTPDSLANVRSLLNVNTTNVNSVLNDISVTTSLTNVKNALNSIVTSDVDISNWDAPLSLPSTSREKIESKSVARICGQSVCLDDSILKRTAPDDDEFFAEIDKVSDTTDDLDDFSYTQRFSVTDNNRNEEESQPQNKNITVIEVSNKVPHTAIPILGTETNIFDFNFKQNLTIKPTTNQPEFVNIVNTETTDNRYGTIFNKDSDYGHISLTTTVNVTDDSDAALTADRGDVKVTGDRSGAVNVTGDSVYERLCMASTSNVSPVSVRRLRSESNRKSSLPNLELESAYECLFPSQDNSRTNGDANVRNSNANSNAVTNSNVNVPNSNSNVTNGTNSNGISSVPILNSVPISNRNIELTRLRSNIERSHSQNTYDSGPRVRERRVVNNSPQREKNEKPAPTNIQQKPIWRRGLTELSLLTRLKSIGLKRQDSPTRECDIERTVTSPTKVVRRPRTGARVDSVRRRSNSLSNAGGAVPPGGLVPAAASLRSRQAGGLRAEQARGACAPAAVPARDPPLLADYERAVWIARWNSGGSRCGGRSGDKLAAVGGIQPTSASHARQLIKGSHKHMVDILFHRVPLAKIFVITKKDHELLGIKLDSECTIQSVDGDSPASRAGLPPGKWAVTEVNNRPINLIKGGEEEMNRISSRGTEASILIQPTALVKKLRAAVKANRPLLALR